MAIKPKFDNFPVRDTRNLTKGLKGPFTTPGLPRRKIKLSPLPASAPTPKRRKR